MSGNKGKSVFKKAGGPAPAAQLETSEEEPRVDFGPISGGSVAIHYAPAKGSPAVRVAFIKRVPTHLKKSQGRHVSAYCLIQEVVAARIHGRTVTEALTSIEAMLNEYIVPGRAQDRHKERVHKHTVPPEEKLEKAARDKVMRVLKAALKAFPAAVATDDPKMKELCTATLALDVSLQSVRNCLKRAGEVIPNHRVLHAAVDSAIRILNKMTDVAFVGRHTKPAKDESKVVKRALKNLRKNTHVPSSIADLFDFPIDDIVTAGVAAVKIAKQDEADADTGQLVAPGTDDDEDDEDGEDDEDDDDDLTVDIQLDDQDDSDREDEGDYVDDSGRVAKVDEHDVDHAIEDDKEEDENEAAASRCRRVVRRHIKLCCDAFPLVLAALAKHHAKSHETPDILRPLLTKVIIAFGWEGLKDKERSFDSVDDLWAILYPELVISPAGIVLDDSRKSDTTTVAYRG
jgi:hypothetical protein